MPRCRPSITALAFVVTAALVVTPGLTGCQASPTGPQESADRAAPHASRTTDRHARHPGDTRAPRITVKLDPVARAKEQDRLLQIVEDTSQPTGIRHGALRQLELHATSACTPRLLRMLPGEWDIVTYRILVILETLRDPAALPKLEAMRSSMDRVAKDRRHTIPNSVVKALDGAIEACSDKRVATGKGRAR